jgi:hypothetical protein
MARKSTEQGPVGPDTPQYVPRPIQPVPPGVVSDQERQRTEAVGEVRNKERQIEELSRERVMIENAIATRLKTIPGANMPVAAGNTRRTPVLPCGGLRDRVLLGDDEDRNALRQCR